MKVDRVFSTAGVHPFDQITWEFRTAEIKDEKGRVVFRQENVEVPSFFSQLATNIVASKYFYGDKDKGDDPRNGGREHSVKQLVSRVADTITDWGIKGVNGVSYFDSPEDGEIFRDELTWLLVNQYGAFNSPVWFNVGIWDKYGVVGSPGGFNYDENRGLLEVQEGYKYPQGSACFLQSVEDTMQSIMALATSEAMLFRHGSGTGSNLSNIRSSKEKLSGGGKPSGPVSFMKIYDRIAGVVKSGGKCLAPYQPVFTATGVKSVKELAESGKDFVALSYSRRAGRVVARTARAFRSGKKQVWSLVTSKGEFHLSYDHPMMLANGHYVALRDLKPGMSLMASAQDINTGGYSRIGLRDGKKGRGQLHQMVAADVLGWDIDGKVVHHVDENKLNNDPSNFQLLGSHAEHAYLHSKARIDAGEHIFQKQKFPKKGSANGMHRDSDFYKDAEKFANYAQKQRDILIESGRSREMQDEACKSRMLNLGYEMINAGADISDFGGYIEARKRLIGRLGTTDSKVLERIESRFGSYDEYYAELRRNNHEVISVRPVAEMEVYDVEVDDPSEDNQDRWNEHNFAIRPLDQTGWSGSCVFVHNTRRAAKLQVLNANHPDIFEYVRCKLEEEDKAKALIAQGYDSNFNGEAYSSVHFQNANLSVGAFDDFMQAVENGDKYRTIAVSTGEVIEEFDAVTLLDEIAKGTWRCGDPGLIYLSTSNKWHTVPEYGPIETANPCIEYQHISDSSCNLASQNLIKFRNPDGTFDIKRFRASCRIFISAQEMLVSNCSYPTQKIAINSENFRPLGLGFANIGGLLMSLGIPYDSDEGRSLAGAIIAILTGEAYLTSSDHAHKLGPFKEFPKNRDAMIHVMDMHRNAAYESQSKAPMGLTNILELWQEATSIWDDVVTAGEDHGYRNSQASNSAPTGTIAFLMDCDCTGVEPDIALVKYKMLAGGGMLKIVNQGITLALTTLGYDSGEIAKIVNHINKYDTIEDCDGAKSGLNPDHLPVFDCAFKAEKGSRFIHYRGHINMMAAIQPFLSGAISKTVNMPESSTVEDIRNAYLEGWRLGLKALAIYRDNSKSSQPLNTKSLEDKDEKPAKVVEKVVEKIVQRPTRERLPETRQSITHKFDIQGHEGYVTVGLYPDGRPGEIFVKMAKEGSTIGGFMDVFGTSVSIGLQYGVPLSDLIDKFEHTKFEPSGYTKNEEIRIASSVPDYIFRWLKQEFPNGSWRGMSPFDLLMIQSNSVEQISKAFQVPIEVLKPEQSKKVDKDANTACPICGGLMVPTGRCHTCPNCAYAGGCG